MATLENENMENQRQCSPACWGSLGTELWPLLGTAARCCGQNRGAKGCAPLIRQPTLGSRAAAGPFIGAWARRAEGEHVRVRGAQASKHTEKGKYPGGRLKPLGSRGAVFAGGLRDGPLSGSLVDLRWFYPGSLLLALVRSVRFPGRFHTFSNERASRKARPGGWRTSGVYSLVPSAARLGRYCKKIASCIGSTVC